MYPLLWERNWAEHKLQAYDQRCLDAQERCPIEARYNPEAERTDHRWLLDKLRDALPTPEDMQIILQQESDVCGYFHQITMAPYDHLEPDGRQSVRWLTHLHDLSSPILLAKGMWTLAIYIQNLGHEYNEHLMRLSESPKQIMQRLAKVASSSVTAVEECLNTADGLECIMLEGVFAANGGSLWRALVTFRRAIAVAQIVRLHRSYHSPADSTMNLEFKWFRILYMERLLCLLLGLPQGSQDESVAMDAASGTKMHPMERLERLHSAIASKILKRNEGAEPPGDTIALRAIDLDLQDAANCMPPQWWLAPDLSAITDKAEIFWSTLRLTNQLFHYYLLSQLYLPCMLSPSSECQNTNSTITCINSSREVLTRFLIFRTVNKTIAFCCRAADFFALLASVALVLAHIGSHSTLTRNSFLAHQRHSDRTLVERVLESMDEVSRGCQDVLFKQSADVLRQLMNAETAVFNHNIQHSRRSEDEECATTDNWILRLRVPCFGTIFVTRSGFLSNELAEMSHHNTQSLPESPPDPASAISPTSPSLSAPAATESRTTRLDCTSKAAKEAIGVMPSFRDHSDPMAFADAIGENARHETAHPSSFSDMEGWGVQGVDITFFESLIKAPMPDVRF